MDKKELQNRGYGLGGVWDNTRKQIYYTPDGRKAERIVQCRERQDGKVYDILLAEGYTLTPPANPKLYCSGCDRWHDTQKEVDVCVKRKKAIERKGQRIAEKMTGSKDKKIEALEAKVDKLTNIIEKLLEGKNGTKI